MNWLFLLAQTSFIIWAVRNIFFWVGIWQIKEYRLDRTLVHLVETTQGKKLLFSPFSILKWIIALAYIIPVFYDDLLFAYQIVITSIFTTEAMFVFKEILTNRFRRPAITIRSVLTLGLSSACILLFLRIPLLDKFLWILFLDRILPLIVGFFIYSLSVPSDFIKDIQIEKSIKLLNKNKGLIRIGVSGSYGKSSTKEYVAQILSTKFKVIKTEGSRNTPVGVAYAVLNQLKSNTQIFVAELGSYKKGEVRELCQIIKPQIGISTGISNQHISLFKNFHNIIETEFELIEALPAKGIALFNGNNKYTKQLFTRANKRKVLYRTILEKKDKPSRDFFFASKIHVYKKSSSFTVTIENKSIYLKTPLLGEHSIENVLPGIYLGYYFGLNDKQIKDAVASLYPPEKTMVPIDHASGAVLIDDTFNTSPESIIAAVSYMRVYKGNKIMVLQPMIELGGQANEEHLRVAKIVGEVCDYLFLTNRNFYKQIKKGLSLIDHPCKIFLLSSKKTADYISNIVGYDDIVMFEGKETGWVLKRLAKKF